MNFALNPPNSLFNTRVWDIVRRIPRGRVASYGQIAKLVGLPEGMDAETYRAFGARWVGSAMSACPPDVPWQRVLNAKGEISLKGNTQRRLLEAEGVVFDAKGRVDLKRYGWAGPEGDGQMGLLGMTVRSGRRWQFGALSARFVRTGGQGSRSRRKKAARENCKHSGARIRSFRAWRNGSAQGYY